MEFEVGDIVRIAKNNPETYPELIAIRDNKTLCVITNITSDDQPIIFKLENGARHLRYASKPSELRLVRRG